MNEAAARPDVALLAESRRLARRFERAARRVRWQSDSEGIHDTRVSGRRLEAALDLLRGLVPARARRRARRAVRAIRRALGPARECQVNAALLAQRLHAPATPAPPATASLLARLERRRVRRERRAASACSRARVARAMRRLRRALDSRATREPEFLAAEWLAGARRRAEARSSVAWSVLRGALASGDDDALHQARIAIKRARYSLERLAASEGTADASALERLIAVQELLGLRHDRNLARDLVLRAAERLQFSQAEAARWLRDLARQLGQEADEAVEGLRRIVEPDASEPARANP